MLNIAETLNRWCRTARPFALATVTGVSGSAPLPVGTALAVNADGVPVGSISGGCVEGAVYDLCRELLASGEPPARARFRYSDGDAFAVGLTFGGELEIMVQRVDPVACSQLAWALTEVVADRPVAVAQVVDGPEPLLGSTLSLFGDGSAYAGTIGSARQDRAVAARVAAVLRSGHRSHRLANYCVPTR
ncbi:XdhC family protein [Nocardia abscessus]|uniref:XdhC family protein n=1 Tax=Nocardia abscessus TaxID=120957 RepID=UPI00245806EE|nr:XdhC family protein [Nocardia abscessus]